MTQAPPELVSFLETLSEPHILFDARYRILAANSAYRRLFGPAGEVVGRTCYAVSHRFDVPCDQAGESCPLARARVSGRRERVLHLHHTPSGEAYVNIELVPLQGAAGEPVLFIEKMEPLPIADSLPAAQGLIGRSPAFQAMLSLVARVGPSMANVLLLGESGTGKELLARAVHDASPRRAAPLVVVDCASLPETLFESELFGHERGAFTGANASKPGLVEAAQGGTLFLDEVGDIPPAMQVKLLRLLESGTYRRVGSTDLRRTDVRVVSATHCDLPALVDGGRFREDLYYRLCTFPIHLPALRERSGDIPLLAAALLARVAPQRRLTLSEEALHRLQQHPFPGNVRELRNVLECAALLSDGPHIEAAHVQQALGGRAALSLRRRNVATWPSGAEVRPVRGADASAGPGPHPPLVETSLRGLAQAALREHLQAHTGSRAELARKLGISQRSLYRKLREIEGR